MLKEIDSVFCMNSLAFIFSEHHLNLKMIIFTSFFFHGVLTSRSNFTISHGSAHLYYHKAG